LSSLSVLILTTCFSLAMGYVISSRTESGGVPDPHANDSVLPQLQFVIKTNGVYNISLAFVNVTYRERLDNILLNPNSEEEVTGLVAYLNGTALPSDAPITCSLNSGDSLRVDLTMPCTEFASGEELYLCIMGDCFMAGKTIKLP
jgi:hypothetical protein